MSTGAPPAHDPDYTWLDRLTPRHDLGYTEFTGINRETHYVKRSKLGSVRGKLVSFGNSARF